MMNETRLESFVIAAFCSLREGLDLSYHADIGSKVKQLRTAKNYTIKQLSEESGLSVGYLSQFERGLSSIAIDSLEKIARILEVDLTVFFARPEPQTQSPVVRGFELLPDEISPQIYQYVLSSRPEEFELLPRMFLLMPFADSEKDFELYSHEGEEFLYVLEGIVTVYLEGCEYVLYPGDSVHIHSAQRHNWMNRTNKTAKIIQVNVPNPLNKNKE